MHGGSISMPDRPSMVLQVDHIGYLDRRTVEGEASSLPGKALLLLRRFLHVHCHVVCRWASAVQPDFVAKPNHLHVQIMSVGGNGRARQFFKQHGWSELGADKIEQKVSMQDCGEICLSQSSFAYPQQHTKGTLLGDQNAHHLKTPRGTTYEELAWATMPCRTAADADKLLLSLEALTALAFTFLAALLPAVHLPGSAEVQAAAGEGCGQAVGAAQARGPGRGARPGTRARRAHVCGGAPQHQRHSCIAGSSCSACSSCRFQWPGRPRGQWRS